MYKSIIVCEGIHDESRIKEVFKDAFCITTNGSSVSKETLNMIKEYSKEYKIIIFTDPDHPGERIRHMILQVVPNASEAFLEKKKCISNNKKKVGIEHASHTDIKKALSKFLDKENPKGNLKINDLIDLGLSGFPDSSFKREKISTYLNIGKPNSKTFLKRINALNISKNKLKELIGNINE